MSLNCTSIEKKQIHAKKNLTDLRRLWDGESIRLTREDGTKGKTRNVKDTIKETYGKTSEQLSEQLFQEVVWRSTYKVGDEGYSDFTDGDFRRIANEIQKEARRLENPRLSWLERIGFVKRGVMSKWAVTSWMNKHINLSTNYERNQFQKYLSRNIKIAESIRAESFLRDPSLRNKFSFVKDGPSLDKLERKLIAEKSSLRELTGEAKNKKADEIAKIELEIADSLLTNNGQILSELVEFLKTEPNEKGKRLRKYQDEVRDKFTNKIIKESVSEGQPFSTNVERAGLEARKLLDDMGKVLINGLKRHEQSILISYKNLPTERVNKYIENIRESQKTIEKGIEKGDYYPHFITEGLATIESVTNKMEALGSDTKRMTNENRIEKQNEFFGELENSFSLIRQSLGKVPDSARDRSSLQYDNWIKNPLTVMRKYSMDAIAFNRTNYLKSVYLKGMEKLPKDPNVAKELNHYLNDVFTLASRGYQDRPVWVNKAVRTLTGVEFLSKIGFGVGTAIRNTMSGMYFIQSVGAFAFTKYLRDTNKWSKEFTTLVEKVESENGFRFEDLTNPLFTEGLLPTEGVRVSDVDIKVDSTTNKATLQYKTNEGWQRFDSALTRATGAGAIFQKVTENFLRKHMFRYSFKDKYDELIIGGLSSAQAEKAAKVHALDMVNKYAFEYSASQKAPIAGGTSKDLGAAGQIAFQFMHYPMSFLQLQSSLLRNSKDAILARQWNNPDVYIPLKFAGLYLFTQLMSGLTNTDLNRLMENDTLDRIKDLKNAIDGEEVKGRGYIGPAVGDLMYYATLFEWMKLPDNQITDLIVGYNNAYKLTDEQKRSRLLSTFNVELAKQPRNWEALQNGTIWSVMMHETGLYPRAHTREMRKKAPLKWLPWDKKKKKKTKSKKEDKIAASNIELQKLYRAMGV